MKSTETRTQQERAEDVKVTTRLIQEEMQAFTDAGMDLVKQDVLRFALYLREKVDRNNALLDLIHRGLITVELSDPEDMETATLIKTIKEAQ